MRALSIKQPWAELIARGEKKIEYRTWKVDFREPLLVVASTARQDDKCREHGIDPSTVPYGKAVCVVDLVDVKGDDGDYEWHLANPRRVEPVAITGYAAVYNVDNAKVRFDDGSSPPATTAAEPPKKTRSKPKPADEPSADDEGLDESTVLEDIVLVVANDPERLAELAQWAAAAAPKWDVLVAFDGKRAIAGLERLPRIIVAEARLARASGLELLQHARDHVFARHAKVAILADEAFAASADELGADVVLPMDAKKAALSKAIGRFLEEG